MNELLMIAGFGLLLSVIGILILKHENRLFQEAKIVQGTVSQYYEYTDHSGEVATRMYTMVVDYITEDGSPIHAKEQSGSTRKKYPIGTQLTIRYSPLKPDFFVIDGDNSRKIIFVGMILVGLAMMIGFGYLGIQEL